MFDFEGDPFWTPAQRPDVPQRTALRATATGGATSRSGRTTAPTRRRRSSARRSAHGAARRATPTCTSTTTAGRAHRGQAADGRSTRRARPRSTSCCAAASSSTCSRVDQAGAAGGRAQLLAEADRAARRVRALRGDGRRLRSRARLRAVVRQPGPGRARRHRGLQRGGLPRDASRCATGCSSVRPAGVTGARADRVRRCGTTEDAEAATARELLRQELTAGAAAGIAALARRRVAGVPPPRGATRLVAVLRLREMDESELMRRRRGARRTDADRRAPRTPARSYEYDAALPGAGPQDRAGHVDRPGDRQGASTSARVDDAERTGRASGAAKDRADEPLPRALTPGGPIDTRAQRGALLRLATPCATRSDRFRALQDVLAQRAAAVLGRRSPARRSRRPISPRRASWRARSTRAPSSSRGRRAPARPGSGRD